MKLSTVPIYNIRDHYHIYIIENASIQPVRELLIHEESDIEFSLHSLNGTVFLYVDDCAEHELYLTYIQLHWPHAYKGIRSSSKASQREAASIRKQGS